MDEVCVPCGKAKVYVEVDAVFTRNGDIIPKSLRWRDGSLYEIQRVTDIRYAACLAAGGRGLRYTCIIDGHSSHVYYDGNNRWFVEAQTAEA